MSSEQAVARQQTAIEGELSVAQVLAQVQKIQELMKAGMREGEHFGVIPGTERKNEKGEDISKPSLLKPGAEKLCLMFRLAPEYESAERYDGDHLTIKSKCALSHIPTGRRLGSGEGSCSTKEVKYAYRHGKRKCPKCGVEQINRSKYPPKNNPDGEPGWYCHAKGGGCGAGFEAKDPTITSQSVGRIVNPDLPDQYNTILKMANKRSLIAAVLNATAASDIFTQDIGDDEDAESPLAPGKKPDDPAKDSVFPAASGTQKAPPIWWDKFMFELTARKEEKDPKGLVLKGVLSHFGLEGLDKIMDNSMAINVLKEYLLRTGKPKQEGLPV